MPTVITHAVSAAALTTAFPNRSVPRRLIILGGICAMAPDLDVFGFRFGIRYEDLWGHRGLTHSLMFAFCLSGSRLACCHTLCRRVCLSSAALAVSIPSERIAWRARRLHKRWPWHRILVPVRHDSLFLLISSD